MRKVLCVQLWHGASLDPSILAASQAVKCCTDHSLPGEAVLQLVGFCPGSFSVMLMLNLLSVGFISLLLVKVSFYCIE